MRRTFKLTKIFNYLCIKSTWEFCACNKVNTFKQICPLLTHASILMKNLSVIQALQGSRKITQCFLKNLGFRTDKKRSIVGALPENFLVI